MPKTTLHKARQPRKQPKIFFSVFDEQLVRCALDFANATIASDDEAAELFRQVAQGRPRGELLSDFDAGGAFAVANWSNVQEKLRHWLPLVERYGRARLSKAEQDDLRRDINKHLMIFDEARNLQVTPDGLALSGITDSDSIGGAVMRALAAFLVPEGIAPSRLGRCRYRNCGKWFLRPPPKRGSVPFYCSPAHASSERVMAFRSRQRQAAAKAK